MKGLWYINGIDIYTHYGMSIEKGAYGQLLSFPSFKAPLVEDWHESDGVDVDLENPKLQNKQVKITFISTTPGLHNDFITLLSSPGYRELFISSLGKKWILRVSIEESGTYWKNGQKRTFMFYDDSPRRFIDDYIPFPVGHGLNLPVSKYEIDGFRLNEFGIIVRNAKSDAFKMPVIKENLERDISIIDGKLVSVKSSPYGQKNVVFDCSLLCDSIDKFWQNYESFFHLLTKPEERNLYLYETDMNYPCYYGGTSNFSFDKKKDYVVLNFSFTLIFISYREGETDYILATESDEDVVMEDGMTYIDLDIN